MFDVILDIFIPDDFENNCAEYRAMLLEVLKEKESENNVASEQKSNILKENPYTEVRGGIGYFKFYKEGENIEIGGKDTRYFRLLECLCNPFGIEKTIESIFDSIKKDKDLNDTDLSSFQAPQRKTKMLNIIKVSCIKELQKIKQLQGKVKYKFNNKKTGMWIELED